MDQRTFCSVPPRIRLIFFFYLNFKESLVRCGRSGLCRRDATHWGTTRCGKSVFHQASFKQIWRVALTCLCLYCSAALLYSSLCCLMPLLTHRPGFLLRLVSATVSKSSEAAAIGSGHISMSRGHPLECNLCVSACLPLRQLEERPPQGNPASVPARLPIRA